MILLHLYTGHMTVDEVAEVEGVSPRAVMDQPGLAFVSLGLQLSSYNNYNSFISVCIVYFCAFYYA